MPAFTMVAECRKALMGVGASMAFGSQMWKGHCALLVAAPRMISKKTPSDISFASPGVSTSCESRHSPAISPKSKKPPSMARPPPPVMRMALVAP